MPVETPLEGPPLSLRLLSLYPKKPGSYVIGKLASLRLPRTLRGPLLHAFASRYGVNLEEAERPLIAYESFLDFFTRRLKPGARAQAPEALGSINSPVDGAIVSEGRVDDGTLIQAKGLSYSLGELFGGDPLAERFRHGHFVTLYLSPKDYHRIHVPVRGRCDAVGRIEGELWPVNGASTAFTPRLYVRNRRAYWIATGVGMAEGLSVGVVMVAATHVGGVVLDEAWTGPEPLPRRGRRERPAIPCEPGMDLGVFELGSTVVLLIGGSRSRDWRLGKSFGPVRQGERLGAFGDSGAPQGS